MKGKKRAQEGGGGKRQRAETKRKKIKVLLSLNSLFSSSLFFFSMPKPSPLLFSTYPRGLPQAKWTPRRSPKKTAVQGRRRRTEEEEEGRGTRASELAPPPSTPKCIDGELYSTLELNSLNLTTQTLSCEEETAAPCAARKSLQEERDIGKKSEIES